MYRFFLFAALVISSLFMMFVALIRAQPYNDANIRDFLTTLNDCLPPCWQDVRPGVTTTTSAVSILEEHAWVHEVDEHIWFSTPGSSLFSWSWNGQQPEWVESKALACW